MATNEEVYAAFLRGTGRALKSRAVRYAQNPEGLHVLWDLAHSAEPTMLAAHFGGLQVFVFNLGYSRGASSRRSILGSRIRERGRTQWYGRWRIQPWPAMAPSEMYAASQPEEREPVPSYHEDIDL